METRNISKSNVVIAKLVIDFLDEISLLSKALRNDKSKKIIVSIRYLVSKKLFLDFSYNPKKNSFENKRNQVLNEIPFEKDIYIRTIRTSELNSPLVYVTGLTEEENIVLSILILALIFNVPSNIIYEDVKKHFKLSKELDDETNYLSAYLKDELVSVSLN